MAFDFENGSYTDAAGRTVLDPAVYKDWQIGAAAEQALPPVTGSAGSWGYYQRSCCPMARPPSWTFCGSWSA